MNAPLEPDLFPDTLLPLPGYSYEYTFVPLKNENGKVVRINCHCSVYRDGTIKYSDEWVIYSVDRICRLCMEEHSLLYENLPESIRAAIRHRAQGVCWSLRLLKGRDLLEHHGQRRLPGLGHPRTNASSPTSLAFNKNKIFRGKPKKS